MERKNEARWIESRKRWQINVQADGDRRTFTSSTPGTKGKVNCERKADQWLREGIVGENTKVDVLLDRYYESLKERTSYGYYNQFENFSTHYIKPIIGKKRISRLTAGDMQEIIDKAYFTRGLAKKTLQNLRGFLNSFLKYCRSHNYCNLFTENLIIPASAKRSEKTILDDNALDTLFSVSTTEFRTIPQEDFFIWAYRFEVVMGFRPGEIVGLLRSNIRETPTPSRRRSTIMTRSRLGKMRTHTVLGSYRMRQNIFCQSKTKC